MEDFGLVPRPAEWALRAGLPGPKHGEGFAQYVTRLGFDPAELLVELTPRTACLAHLRLNTLLQRSMPAAFDKHIDALARAHLDPESRKRIEHSAHMLFPGQCRPRVTV